MISKHVHDYKFTKYIGGKCKNCGLNIQAQYQCADKTCGVYKKVNHVCLGKGARK